MEPTDRRARRTRRRLQEALSRLLLKPRIQDITVQQVTKMHFGDEACRHQPEHLLSAL